MPEKRLMERFRETGGFSDLDLHFARLLTRLDGRGETAVFLAAALTSRQNRAGHVYTDLETIGGAIAGLDQSREYLACPPLEQWRRVLETSPVVGRPGEFKPLILDRGRRLYLHRYFQYQESLAAGLRRRMKASVQVDGGRLREILERLFPPGSSPDGCDWQKTAAAVAACKQFCVISGGPGTGKTTTIARIMALLLELEPAGSLRIALAAPTGKAADRMRTAIRQAKVSLDCAADIRRQIPEEAATIHRLLGGIADSPYFRHHAGRLLPFSLVVVDEASMVDLALMAKLVQALSENARLILVGDHHQLASVEAGAVLGDLSGSLDGNRFSKEFDLFLKETAGCDIPGSAVGESGPGPGDCLVRLQHNYRFSSRAGLGGISRAVQRGDGRKALELFTAEGKDGSVSWVRLPATGALEQALGPMILEAFAPALACHEPLEALGQLNRFRLLCAFREGPYGVAVMNRLSETILARAGLISPRDGWYAGRPVMISANDYTLGLFNGDSGIALSDPMVENRLRVFFQRSDGSLQKVHPARIGPHETAFAVTVHKSQGSEFDRVALILPAHDSPLLTRELIYTGLTRARSHASVWADETVFRAAVERRVERFSGLGELLGSG
ncbi:MAG: exodeoxyribonuclease V subunit alpha [Thermodesulfobacteriota bacterium]